MPRDQRHRRQGTGCDRLARAIKGGSPRAERRPQAASWLTEATRAAMRTCSKPSEDSPMRDYRLLMSVMLFVFCVGTAQYAVAQECSTSCGLQPFGQPASWSYNFDANVPQDVKNSMDRSAIIWSGEFQAVGEPVSVGYDQNGGGVQVVAVPTLNGDWGRAWEPASEQYPSGRIEVAGDFLDGSLTGHTPTEAELNWLLMHESGHALMYDHSESGCLGSAVMHGAGGQYPLQGLGQGELCSLYWFYNYTPPGGEPYVPLPIPESAAARGTHFGFGSFMVRSGGPMAIGLGVLALGWRRRSTQVVRGLRSLACLIIVLACAQPILGQGKAQEKPTKPTVIARPIHADGAPDLVGWDDMVARAELIAHIRLRSKKYVTGPAGVAMTAYQADVVELLKADARAVVQPSTLTIYMLGGVLERPDKYIRETVKDSPEWRTDREYLVALRWNQVITGWNAVFGSNATFEILGEPPSRTVRAVGGTSRFAKQQDGRVLAEIKQAIGQAVRQRSGRSRG